MSRNDTNVHANDANDTNSQAVTQPDEAAEEQEQVPLPPPPEGAPLPAPEPYQPILSNGNLPAPVGKVAHAIQRVFTLAKQRADAETLFNFLRDPANNDLSELNGVNDGCYAAMLALPNSMEVHVIYGIGLCTAGLGQVSPICGKLLVLFGEGGDLGYTPCPFASSSDINLCVCCIAGKSPFGYPHTP